MSRREDTVRIAPSVAVAERPQNPPTRTRGGYTFQAALGDPPQQPQNNASTWGPNVQTQEVVRDALHLNHNRGISPESKDA